MRDDSGTDVGSTSLGRGGAFSELKGQFHSGRTLRCQWGNLADGTLSSKSWCFICSNRRWSDSLCSRRFVHDHPHQTQEIKRVVVRTAIGQNCCERNHERGILETNSFLGMLFDDD